MKNNHTSSYTKYQIKPSSNFKKQLKKMVKQHKNLDELKYVISKLANSEELDAHYHNHKLQNSKKYKNCGECHINPD
jgi:mRNA interferase YafQ